MPTYKNAGASVVTLGSMTLEPGESKSVNTFFKTLPVGVTQDSALPVFDPILQSVKVTSSQTVTIDTTLTGQYRVRVYVTTGEVSLQYNNAASEAVLLGVGMEEDRFCPNRTIDNLIFTISSGTAYVTVERA